LAALTVLCVASQSDMNKAGKAPVGFKNIRQQMRVLAVIRAAGQVVGAHHRLHIRIFTPISNASRSLSRPPRSSDDRVRRGASRLLVVIGVVLDIGDHMLRLYALQMRGGLYLPGQKGILPLVSNVPAVARLAPIRFVLPPRLTSMP